jgi:hypothetical protein
MQTSPGGHLSLATQPDVSLALPPFLASMPLWPTLFLLGPDEGEPLLHMSFYVVGQAHLLLLCPLMTMA